MNRSIIVNAVIGLVGTSLVLASLVLFTSRKHVAADLGGTVDLYAAGESYCAKVKVAEDLLRKDSPYGDLQISETR